jgi:hypothetical protein
MIAGDMAHASCSNTAAFSFESASQTRVTNGRTFGPLTASRD